MPPLVMSWVNACREIGKKFDPNQRPREGIPRGYSMPEAALLANLTNETTRQGFFAMFMKLANLLAYRVGFMGSSRATLTNDEWRQILGSEVLGSTRGSKTDVVRQKLMDGLQALTSTSKVGIATPVRLLLYRYTLY
jgi:hypothetical protein